MRLLWTGVLLLLPLVADLASARRCRNEPDAPEHATLRCFKKRGSCRASCEDGYIFTEKNSKIALYDCQGGEWVMRNGQVDRCDPVCEPSCKNGGYCSAPNQCTCQAGYEGASCQNPVCEPSCKNGGYCRAPNQCTCQAGYEGASCQNPVCEPSCKNGGYCSAPNQCTCHAGYEGASCQNPHCDMECLNGGQCIAPNTCGCPTFPVEWTGRSCEIPVCDPPCENGECTKHTVCDCQDGFTGDYCDEEEEKRDDYDIAATTEEPTIEHSDEYSDEDEDTEVGKSHILTSEVEPVTQSQFVEVMVPLKFEAEAKQLVNRLVAVEYMKQKYAHLVVYPEEEDSN